MNYICNPVNINYRYQFNLNPWEGNCLQICREAADPSMICFQGKYYIFASMTLGVWVSENLADWENHRFPDALPVYDYAPDVRVIGEYVYFSASRNDAPCDFYRTKNILEGPYERIPGTFPFWDPNLFADEDGRVYFFWGCSNTEPIWGVELDPLTMKPLGEKKAILDGNPQQRGYERVGEDHALEPLNDEELQSAVDEFIGRLDPEKVSEKDYAFARSSLSRRPYIEGAWLDKFQGKYYLQYAACGAELNVYADGVYVSDAPLGPYVPAKNNPYSYKPGGFLPGAGHGSTMRDLQGNLWHAATMRISRMHMFERRVGIWPAGLDADGELFCNQRYGDWPMAVPDKEADPWKNPDWFLLSKGKKMCASSSVENCGPDQAADENVQTWWRAASAEPGEWLMMDLGKEYEVHAVQINFADDKMDILVPGEFCSYLMPPRFIDGADLKTRWKLEVSKDGESWKVMEDKWDADSDLSHDLVICEDGIRVHYLKLTVREVPYGQPPCVSGLRVFGKGDGEKPEVPKACAVRTEERSMKVCIEGEHAVGYNILWGHAPEKLYHSYMIFDTEKEIRALVAGENYYVRVDAFNENGITEGAVFSLD